MLCNTLYLFKSIKKHIITILIEYNINIILYYIIIYFILLLKHIGLYIYLYNMVHIKEKHYDKIRKSLKYYLYLIVILFVLSMIRVFTLDYTLFESIGIIVVFLTIITSPIILIVTHFTLLYIIKKYFGYGIVLSNLFNNEQVMFEIIDGNTGIVYYVSYSGIIAKKMINGSDMIDDNDPHNIYISKIIGDVNIYDDHRNTIDYKELKDKEENNW